MRAYVTQNALGGHSIPISKGAIDVLYAVGAINDAEADKGQVPGLERAIPKNKGVEFGSLLQQLAADLVASPGSSKVKAVLAEVESDFKDRLAVRQARQEAQAVADAAAAKEARHKARAEARAAAAALEVKKTPTKPVKETKAGARPQPPAEAKGKPKDKEASASKPIAPAKRREDDDARRSAAKGLAKKKPR